MSSCRRLLQTTSRAKRRSNQPPPAFPARVPPPPTPFLFLGGPRHAGCSPRVFLLPRTDQLCPCTPSPGASFALCASDSHTQFSVPKSGGSSEPGLCFQAACTQPSSHCGPDRGGGGPGVERRWGTSYPTPTGMAVIKNMENNVLARMWRNWDPCTAAGDKHRAAAGETGWRLPSTLEHRVIQQSHPYPQKN